MQKYRFLLVLLLVLTISGCNYRNNIGIANDKREIVLSTWLTYWDMDSGVEELSKFGNKMKKVSYFAAYFDTNEKLFIPEELKNQIKSEKEKKVPYEKYLTIVNDLKTEGEGVSLKDIDLLRRLFSDEEKMQEHITEIINLSTTLGYQGIEIDYEQLWKEPDLVEPFTVFINKLYVQALKNNLKLRVVLEPSAKFSCESFAKGPEYVIMLYNLYGLHSGPGPKADKKFIENTLRKVDKLPGDKTIAFSSGGCIWSKNGYRRFISEAEAVRLAQKYKVQVERDVSSEVLTFKYQDDAAVEYTVWYADYKTIRQWMKISQAQGYNNFSIWRLGGNLDINKLL